MDRPTSVTVLGWLNILFGVWGLCGSVYFLTMVLNPAAIPGPGGRPALPTHPVPQLWHSISIPVAFLATAALTAAGAGLLKMREWARKVSIAYAIYSFVVLPVGVLISLRYSVLPIFEAQGAGPEDARMSVIVAGAVSGVCGGVVALAYPGCLWYFMTRPHVIAALAGRPWRTGATPDELAALQANLPHRQPDSGNPYASPLGPAGPPGVRSGSPAVEGAIEALVPLKNGPALASYYLGLFSLFPLLGLLLAIPAVMLGITGLHRARENPAVRGRVHAWVGLICGLLFGLMNLLLVLLTVIGLATATP